MVLLSNIAGNKKRAILLSTLLLLASYFPLVIKAANQSRHTKLLPLRWFSKFLRRKNMGNVTRAMSYSISKNDQNAISVLEFYGKPLSWFRLDDGVMGGQSETNHAAKDGALHFEGTINTNGGGFTSIRAKIPEGMLTADTTGLKIRHRGDGKTYKVLLSDGNRAGPFSSTPTWQADLPTVKKEDNSWEETTIPFSSLHPAFGGGSKSQRREEEKKQYTFDPSEMKEVGLMLSLRLSDGSPNPPETFGTGLFSFSLTVQSLTPTSSSS